MSDHKTLLDVVAASCEFANESVHFHRAHKDELAQAIRATLAENARLRTALTDAVSTYRDDGKTVLVSEERQEAWREALL